MKTKSTLVAMMFFVCTNLSVTAYAQAVNVEDSLALVDLYNSTDGPHWRVNYNWLTGPVATWYGITLTDARVTEINLHNNKLTGVIPTQIGNLSNLDTLSLYGNKLSSLPPEIGNLVTLRYLDLSSNQLNSLPPEIGNLKNLTVLYLSVIKLSSLPPEIGNLVTLRYLDLSGNKLNSIPHEIGNLENLSTLYLSYNTLSTLPPEIGNLTNLDTLELYDNTLTSVPPEIGNLVTLRYLDLSSNQLNSLPPEIGNLANLKDLALAYNILTSLPPEIGNLANLDILYLDGNKLSSLPSEIGNLANLKDLALAYNILTSLPPEIGNLSNLMFLRLFGNQLNSIPPEIGNLIILTYLSLSANQLSSLPPEIGNLVSVTGLDLSQNQLSSLPPEIGNLVGLTGLVLSQNQLSSLPPEIGNLVNVFSLNLSYNQLSSLPPEIGNLVNVVYLDLSHNKLSILPPEIGNLVNVFSLDLYYNQLISLPHEIGNLNGYLSLGNNHLTFDDLEIVVQKLPYAVYYSPQANIALHQNNASLAVSAGGRLNNNTYNWYKLGNQNPTTIDGDSVFHPSSNGKYYAAITNSICTQLTLNTDTIDYDAVLPVTLINLKAQQLGGIIKVDWSSLTELNVARYEVQRSANANAFSSIGSIAAKGNGTRQQNYSFNDLQPLSGNNYYRLKAIDKNGIITYSKTVLVNISGDQTFTIVYPNPAKDILHIQTNGSASFSLINQAGKILLNKNINGNGSMNVGGFAAGLYYLKNNSNGVVQKVVMEK